MGEVGWCISMIQVRKIQRKAQVAKKSARVQESNGEMVRRLAGRKGDSNRGDGAKEKEKIGITSDARG